jgi:hypothetical protein
MHPTTSRLRLALVTLAFVCAVALSGIIVQKPHGGLASGVSTGFIQGWPIKYLAVGKMHLEDISVGVITDKPRKTT